MKKVLFSGTEGSCLMRLLGLGKSQMQLEICTDRIVSNCAVKPQRHTVGLTSKGRQKLNCKNSEKLTDHTYICNSFTSFGHDAHPFTGNGNSESCLEKNMKSH